MARSLRPYGPGTARFSPCGTWRYELTRDLSACPHPTKPPRELLKQSAPDRQEVIRTAAAGLMPRAGILLSIGLNPSTATGEDDDPTIHKESGFAIAWGHELYLKANAFAFRATEPDDMFEARDRGIDIVGPDNDRAIAEAVDRVRREGGRVLAAWGQHIDEARQREVAALLVGVEVVCVDVNKDGSPSHPLYKKPNLRPWICPPASVRSKPRTALPGGATAALVTETR